MKNNRRAAVCAFVAWTLAAPAQAQSLLLERGQQAAVGGDDRSLLRLEIEEQSFRRETYRAARVGFVRRF
jgi:hypothetical protein